MSIKSALRAKALTNRRLRAASARHTDDQALCARVRRLATGHSRVAAYLPLLGEPGGFGLADELAAVASVIVPVLRLDQDLDWVYYNAYDDNAYGDNAHHAGQSHDTPRAGAPSDGAPPEDDATHGGLPAPPAALPPASPTAGGRPTRLREPTGARLGQAAIGQVELVLVPALAVDRAGTRLGRGGGSYDRALARVRPDTPVIALLYDEELIDVLPAEPHDRPVTAVLTPTGLYSTRRT